jgi:hypothetical protein
MKKVILKILLGLVVVIVLFLAFVATRSADYRASRSLVIAAPPDVLFGWVNNHRRFNEWNPWLKLDPNVKNTYSGPDAGVGAACSWDGDSNIGAGTATITESKPGELVRMRMEWKRPMEGVGTVEFTFKPEGDKTAVTWLMYGKNGFMGKLVSVFIDCDAMVGPKFEEGLASLAAVATKRP